MIPNGCSLVTPSISLKVFNSKFHFSSAYGGIPSLPSRVSYQSIRSSWKPFQGLTLQSSIEELPVLHSQTSCCPLHLSERLSQHSQCLLQQRSFRRFCTWTAELVLLL